MTLTFALLAASVARTFAHYECQWETPNATYDLCSLQLDGGDDPAYYEVFDDSSDPNFNFTYVFNLCSELHVNPPDALCYNNTLRDAEGFPTGFCAAEDINATNRECAELTDITARTAAYQMRRGHIHDECFRLHDGQSPPTFGYIEPSDPSVGVTLTYENGDWCEAAGRNREFRVELYCNELDDGNLPDKVEETVLEDEVCQYTLTIETAFGCPSECPRAGDDGAVCGGHGVCEFDHAIDAPRCFCFWGFCGDDCATESTQCNAGDKLFGTDFESTDDCVVAMEDDFGLKAFYDLNYFHLEGENFVVDDEKDREYAYQFNICGDLENFHEKTQIPASCTDYGHGPCTHWSTDADDYDYSSTSSTSSTSSPRTTSSTPSHWNTSSTSSTSTTWYTPEVCLNQFDAFDAHSVPKAVQIYTPSADASATECYWLGMDLPSGFDLPSSSVSLVDSFDSGRGVVYIIENGEPCEEEGLNRQIDVELRCPSTTSQRESFSPEREARSVFDEAVFEWDVCRYVIGIESPLACPLQCIEGIDVDRYTADSSSSSSSGSYTQQNATFSVCSNRGVCASDPEAQMVRCLCDKGWSGRTCNIRTEDINGGGSSTSSSGANGTAIGIGVAIAVVALVIVGVFFFMQRRKKMAVLNGYGNMSGSINDVGLVTS